MDRMGVLAAAAMVLALAAVQNFDARRVQRFLYKGLGSPNSAEGVIPPARAVQ